MHNRSRSHRVSSSYWESIVTRYLRYSLAIRKSVFLTVLVLPLFPTLFHLIIQASSDEIVTAAIMNVSPFIPTSRTIESLFVPALHCEKSKYLSSLHRYYGQHSLLVHTEKHQNDPTFKQNQAPQKFFRALADAHLVPYYKQPTDITSFFSPVLEISFPQIKLVTHISVISAHKLQRYHFRTWITNKSEKLQNKASKKSGRKW